MLAVLLAASVANMSDDRLIIDVTEAKKFDWKDVVTSSNGEIYKIASDEISDVDYLGVPMKQTLMLIENFKGTRGGNRRWSNIYVHCEQSAYNIEWSVEYEEGSQDGVVNQNNDHSLTNAGVDTPVGLVIQKVCEKK